MGSELPRREWRNCHYRREGKVRETEPQTNSLGASAFLGDEAMGISTQFWIVTVRHPASHGSPFGTLVELFSELSR